MNSFLLILLAVTHVGAGVLGFWLRSHIHAVANEAASAATRAVTVPSGVLAQAPAPIAGALLGISETAKTAIESTAGKIG